MRVLIFLSLILPSIGFTQDKPLTISGFADAYYGYDFLKPNNHNRAGFLYNHTRHNEVNLNLAYLKATYQTDKVRANLALGTGTYMQYNYAAEPSILQNIYEANIGVNIGKNTWIDVGVMPSHIGFESAVSKDCWTLSRSLLAENSPYFETGVKLSTAPTEKLSLAFLYLNGWQRIKRVDGNSTPAFGTQLTYKASEKTTLNWSTFVGNDKPDSVRQMRYFNNFYGIFQLSKQFGITASFDVGFEQKLYKSSKLNAWFSPVIIARLKASGKWGFALRGEYYKDANGVIISSNIKNFGIFGASLNADYKITDNVVYRIEARNLTANGAVFSGKNGLSKDSFSLLNSLAISF